MCTGKRIEGPARAETEEDEVEYRKPMLCRVPDICYHQTFYARVNNRMDG